MIIVEFCDYYKFILKLKGERISKKNYLIDFRS